MAGHRHAMSRRRAEDAAMTLFSIASASRTSPSCSTGARMFRINLSRPLTTSRASSAPYSSSRPRCQHRYNQSELWLKLSRRRYATLNENGHIAVVGGGLTGLTTAYYLTKQLPSTAKITLYEGSDRLGGWIQTDRVPVDVDGVKGTVSFERGPRTLSSLHTSSWRFDDLILYDLVSIRSSLCLLLCSLLLPVGQKKKSSTVNQHGVISNRLSISASKSLRLPTNHAISTIQTT